MTHRLLPPSEWDALVGTDLETAIPTLDPARASVLVVEDAAGAVVGCWAFLWVLHAEAGWVAPAHRGKGVVFKHLVAGLHEVARAEGVPVVWTCADRPAIDRLAGHLGGTLIEARSYAIPTVKGDS